MVTGQQYMMIASSSLPLRMMRSYSYSDMCCESVTLIFQSVALAYLNSDTLHLDRLYLMMECNYEITFR